MLKSGKRAGQPMLPIRLTNRPANICRKTASEIQAVCAVRLWPRLVEIIHLSINVHELFPPTFDADKFLTSQHNEWK